MYHEKQTPLEVQVSMMLSLPARMLGFVQPDLGSVAGEGLTSEHLLGT